MMQADNDDAFVGGGPKSNESVFSGRSAASVTAPRRRQARTEPSVSTRLVAEVQKDQEVVFATVKRNYCGTGAFDRNWLNMDCCGLFSAGLTYLLHAYGVYAVCFVMLPPWMSENIAAEDGTSIRQLTWAGTLHSAFFSIIALMAVISHFYAMTTNPGAVPPDAKPLEMSKDTTSNGEEGSLPKKVPQGLRLCRRCKAYKPPRAHHCSVCRRCIIKMDHHCPWVNNCVGIGNHKYFLLFIFYTFLSCAYSMTLIITRFSGCVHSHHRRHHLHGAEAAIEQAALAIQQQPTCLDKPSQLLVILGLIIEALLFGMFTSCMMFDQAEVVKHKTTHIDRLKGLEVGGSLEGISEVFGVGTNKKPDNPRFRMDWLSPFRRVCFPGGLQEEVYGFCLPVRETEMTATRSRKPGSESTSTANNALRSVAEIV